MPAHFSGVDGFKPTHGRVANWPMSNNELATHIGPLARSVADAALMTQALAGPHPWDDTSLEARPRTTPRGPCASSRRWARAWSR